MSVKFLLAPVLLELYIQLRKKGMELRLDWIPRDLNSEADALSNMNFDGFDPALCLPVAREDTNLYF